MSKVATIQMEIDRDKQANIDKATVFLEVAAKRAHRSPVRPSTSSVTARRKTMRREYYEARNWDLSPSQRRP